MIHRDRSWPRFFTKDSIEGSADRLTRYQSTSLSHRTLSTPVINDCEHSKRPPIGQGIMDKIHPPPLGGSAGVGAGPRCRAICVRRRTRMRGCNPSSRYNRRTRFRFTRQPSRRRSTQMRVFLLPGVESRITHPELPAEVADGGAGFGLANRVQDLLLRELRPLHGSVPFVEDRRSCHRTLV